MERAAALVAISLKGEDVMALSSCCRQRALRTPTLVRRGPHGITPHGTSFRVLDATATVNLIVFLLRALTLQYLGSFCDSEIVWP